MANRQVLNISPEQLVIPNEEVQRFLTPVGKVTDQDIDRTKPTLDAILHVIRHLTIIDQSVARRYLGKITSEGQIVNQTFIDGLLKTFGSKFHSRITDPEQVIQWCLGKFREVLNTKTIPWYENPVTREQTAMILFMATPVDKKLFGIPLDERMGTISVVDITPEIAPHVAQETRGSSDARDNLNVNVVHGVKPPTSDQVLALIRRASPEATPDFYTAYTGIEAPSFPRPSEQTAEEMTYNFRWWAKRAFVKED